MEEGGFFNESHNCDKADASGYTLDDNRFSA